MLFKVVEAVRTKNFLALFSDACFSFPCEDLKNTLVVLNFAKIAVRSESDEKNTSHNFFFMAKKVLFPLKQGRIKSYPNFSSQTTLACFLWWKKLKRYHPESLIYLRSETNETPPIHVILMFFFTSPTKQSIDTPELYSVLLQSLLAD